MTPITNFRSYSTASKHRSINTRVMRVQYYALRVQLKHTSDLWDSFFTFFQAQKIYNRRIAKVDKNFNPQSA